MLFGSFLRYNAKHATLMHMNICPAHINSRSIVILIHRMQILWMFRAVMIRQMLQLVSVSVYRQREEIWYTSFAQVFFDLWPWAICSNFVQLHRQKKNISFILYDMKVYKYAALQIISNPEHLALALLDIVHIWRSHLWHSLLHNFEQVEWIDNVIDMIWFEHRLL